ncbi:DNA primase large subunit PriL [Salinirubrum litoreum]|uniref:DNA primase large subunit PriL n=1 Tax=Salinirubrum litoreum TaxID=1126234 RepID=A0ABD5R5W2_9EURY|nr:DNA primase large subunit PriL [Salinirubrum litoreum]
MRALDAKYPFFDAARETVEQEGADLPTLIAEDAPAVERGLERVERALLAGTVESEDTTRFDRNELLSYPIARILVSLVDAPAAVQKYAAAEAATARARFEADFAQDDDLRTGGASVDLDTVLREFDLADAVIAESPADRPARSEDRYRVAVGAYLRLSTADWGDGWRLVNRELADGRVRVTRAELSRLLEVAVERRVAEGLPFEGIAENEALVEALDEKITDLRELLADRSGTRQLDTVVPELFPPCMDGLLRRVQRGADLDAEATFSLTAFLTGIGMDTDEIVALYRDSSVDAETIRYQIEYLQNTPVTQYPPPSCATMEAYDLCVKEDDERGLCESVSHPMSYYGDALASVEASEIDDWRNRGADPEEAESEA